MYHLHTREVQLAAGRKQRIYYFAGVASKGSVDALPDGYEVFENERTGLPMLRKKGGAAKKKVAKVKKAKKVAKKAAAKKPAVKKAAKKPAAKKAAVKKAVKKPAAKKPAAKKKAAKRR